MLWQYDYERTAQVSSVPPFYAEQWTSAHLRPGQSAAGGQVSRSFAGIEWTINNQDQNVHLQHQVRTQSVAT
jgi:hypothetical protein